MEKDDDKTHIPGSPVKRSLLKSAWLVPLVVAVTLPRSGFAANISGTSGKEKTNNGNHSGQNKNSN